MSNFLASVGACYLILHILGVVNWQLSLAKQGISWPVSYDRIAGSGVNPSRWHVFWSSLLTSYWFPIIAGLGFSGCLFIKGNSFFLYPCLNLYIIWMDLIQLLWKKGFETHICSRLFVGDPKFWVNKGSLLVSFPKGITENYASRPYGGRSLARV